MNYLKNMGFRSLSILSLPKLQSFAQIETGNEFAIGVEVSQNQHQNHPNKFCLFLMFL